ncbi:MAG: AMP-binding protein, partial [Betaproteobacteria bacterium]|nr:AMP-binding protein [Betaproteobacteria bacterium]
MASAEAWMARYRAATSIPSARVLVILEHGEALYSSYLGALLGGFVPAYFAHPSEKISRQRYAEMVQALLATIGADLLVTSADIKQALEPGTALPPGYLEDGTAFDGIPTGPPPRLPQGTALLQFSSGTTGQKKGVPITEASLLWQVSAYGDHLGAGEQDRIATWLPLYHDMGLMACFFLPLVRGIPLAALSPFDWVRHPEKLLAMIEEHRSTLLWLPNFVYNFLCARVPAGRRWDLSSLRAVVNCSEPILERSHTAFLRRFGPMGVRADSLASCYALAENTFAVTSSAAGRAPATNPRNGRIDVSSGPPLPQVDIRIEDADGRLLADGEPGEILIRSPGLFQHYVGEGSTNVPRAQGWFRTADRGYLLNGELYVMGRCDDTMILGGRNVHPQDVEQIVSEVEGVIPGRCAVFGVEDAALGTQVLVVLAETRLRDAAARRALQAAIARELASRCDIAPADVVLVEPMWLLKSTSGKSSRAQNRARYLEERRPAKAAIHTEDTLENIVRSCIESSRSLGAGGSPPRFGPNEDLFSAGILDSFACTALVQAMEDRFGVAQVRAIASSPERFRTVASLVAALSTGAAPAAAGHGSPSARERLAPQMRDADAQPYQWVAYVMRRGMPLYRSASLSSDDRGFRTTCRNGMPMTLAEFESQPSLKAFVLGNSLGYGVGVSHNSRTFASLLNTRAAAGRAWYNLSLRASVCRQERLALELWSPRARAPMLAWVTGVNDLITLVVGEGHPDNPIPFPGELHYLSRMMPGVRAGHPPPFEHRYAAMLEQLEADLVSLARRYSPAGRLGFFLQPSASWIEKRWTLEERALIEEFDAGPPLQQA